MTTATQPIPQVRESGGHKTGPQQILDLYEQDMTQQEVANLLGISQSKVSRNLQIAREQRERQQKRRAQAQSALIIARTILLTLCMVITTAALATIAWG